MSSKQGREFGMSPEPVLLSTKLHCFPVHTELTAQVRGDVIFKKLKKLVKGETEKLCGIKLHEIREGRSGQKWSSREPRRGSGSRQREEGDAQPVGRGRLRWEGHSTAGLRGCRPGRAPQEVCSLLQEY